MGLSILTCLNSKSLSKSNKLNTHQFIVPGMEGQTVMTDEELNTLRHYCLAIKRHYQTSDALDIEFKVDVVDGKRKIYVKQARLF